MIKEAYCSFEASILLKKKGFEGDINAYYHIWDSGDKVCSVQEFRSSEAPHLYIPAPTLQTAMKWLREVHNKHCDIGYDIDLDWFFQIIDLKEIVEYDYPETKYYHTENETGFNTYEEAVEAALKYVLENLI